ncbi:MAG: NAD(+)/NADH kinase [Flavobacteriales bacterium]|jgi:NAD+ kinase|nr:NAD(+)/NADH kinase [Flavobacteriales bacterium]MBK7942645.1 NAD(+)/NADH kinase [Flavobacteriales bacterium]MBK8950832.1 NAD(+)/NADH kinase [Flavobacteriales bacterium]MBK9698951.1 NAD(+)/NADH kinase [Flavobacteriales bacterium]
MRIAVQARHPEPSTLPLIAGLLQAMPAQGLTPVVDGHLATLLAATGNSVPYNTFDPGGPPAGTDLLLSLGGDGTFLRAVGLVARSGIPVLGVNLGRLGFLAALGPDEVHGALGLLAQRRFVLEERMLLQVTGCEAELGGQDLALNDVSVHKRDTSSMIALHVHADDRFLNTYWADGLIIATPTGSTAYSLSCGGPILDPSCHNLVITPISPHNLNIRPMVLPDASVLQVEAEARELNYLVNLDNRSITLSGRRAIGVRKAGLVARIAHLPDHDFFSTLRHKLNWGLDARSAAGPAA